jgi:hypothetical protein
LVISNRQFAHTLLSPALDSAEKEQNKTIFLILGWFFTILTSLIYISFTVKKETGGYQLSDLISFSFLNGILEQFMFIFWFLLGCYLTRQKFPKHSILIFILGYLGYFLYSGAIHPLFWFQVLPEHEPFMPMAFILPFMSLFWMWLFWRYQAIVAIIAMHVAIDFLTVGHLHFPWFESIQLS